MSYGLGDHSNLAAPVLTQMYSNISDFKASRFVINEL